MLMPSKKARSEWPVSRRSLGVRLTNSLVGETRDLLATMKIVHLGGPSLPDSDPVVTVIHRPTGGGVKYLATLRRHLRPFLRGTGGYRWLTPAR
jgi:hypothetical protein